MYETAHLAPLQVKKKMWKRTKRRKSLCTCTGECVFGQLKRWTGMVDVSQTYCNSALCYELKRDRKRKEEDKRQQKQLANTLHFCYSKMRPCHQSISALTSLWTGSFRVKTRGGDIRHTIAAWYHNKDQMVSVNCDSINCNIGDDMHVKLTVCFMAVCFLTALTAFYRSSETYLPQGAFFAFYNLEMNFKFANVQTLTLKQTH